LAGSAVIEVAAGLVFREGRLLIAQRYAADHQGGLWEFPGGKRQSQESFEACLEREIQEELGMEIEVGPMLEEITHAYPDRTVQLRFFRCTWSRHEPRPLGCQAWAWITRDELQDYAFPPADQQLLQRLYEDVELWGGNK